MVGPSLLLFVVIVCFKPTRYQGKKSLRMSENVVPIKDGMMAEPTSAIPNVGDNRNNPLPTPPTPRPPLENVLPQRPQFENQPPRSLQPRFPQGPPPRFIPRTPEFQQQRPVFPPPQGQQNQDPRFPGQTSDPRARYPNPNLQFQRPPGTGAPGPRPPGPFMQRPGSATVRPFGQDLNRSQTVDSKGSIENIVNAAPIKSEDVNKTYTANLSSGNTEMKKDETTESEVKKRNEDNKKNILHQEYGTPRTNLSRTESTSSISSTGKPREGIGDEGIKRQNSSDVKPSGRGMEMKNDSKLFRQETSELITTNLRENDDSKSTTELIGKQFKQKDDSVSQNRRTEEHPQRQEDVKSSNRELNESLKREAFKVSSEEVDQPHKRQESNSRRDDSQPLSQAINEHPKERGDAKPTTRGVDEISKGRDASKLPHQRSEEYPKRKDEFRPLTRGSEEHAKKKDDSRPPSRASEEHSRPPSRASEEHPKRKDDSRPPSRGMNEQAKSKDDSKPSSRPSSRLASTAEHPPSSGKLDESKRNVTKRNETKLTTKTKNRSPSPKKDLSEGSIKNISKDNLHQPATDRNVARRPISLHRSDSYRHSMDSYNLLKQNTRESWNKFRPDGDNDSGVDESTQGNDTRSTENHKPSKKTSKTSSPKSASTPTKDKNIIKTSKSPSLKSPGDLSAATTPGSTEKKKVPMNKVQVGSAPSPNLKEVKSKIGSLNNASYKPGGGQVKIENRKLNFEAKPKIAAKNESYVPSGGEKKIISQKLHWNAKSKIGSLENTAHKPKGGDKKIESVKLDFKEKAKPKVGSKDNMKHQPGGGDIKEDEEDIENKKLEIKAQSKIGSLDNVKHKPGGGDKKIFDDKDYIRQMSGNSLTTSLTNSQTSSQADVREPVSDENLNKQQH